MLYKSVLIFLLIASANVFAEDKGNYLCRDCRSFDENIISNSMIFIKSTVNQDVNRWRPGDTVTLTNGSIYAIYLYHANGNFTIKRLGRGTGPGTKKNYDSRDVRSNRDSASRSSSRDMERNTRVASRVSERELLRYAVNVARERNMPRTRITMREIGRSSRYDRCGRSDYCGR